MRWRDALHNAGWSENRQSIAFHSVPFMPVRSMIYVIATIELHDGARDAFIKAFQANVPNVLEENGCIEYGPAIDIETTIPAQGEVRPNVVMVVEKWSDLDALEAHLIAPHMLTYREQVKELVRGVSLNVLEPAAGE